MDLRRLSRLTAAAIALGTASEAWAKIGLAGRFGDVVLEGVQPGRTYSLREAAKIPFAVENIGDAEMEVLIEFDRPRAGTLAEGYEAIVDPSWFKAVPPRMVVPAHGTGFFDLILNTPDDSAFQGKHYQAQVKAKQAVSGGLGVAVEGRVRLSFGKGPETLAAEKKRKGMQQLDFDVSPQALYLTGVPVGKAWDSRKEARKALRVANYAADPLAVVLTPEPWSKAYALPEGYEPLPDLKWVRFAKSTVTVESSEIGQAGLIVEIPDKPENRGKKWAVQVRTGLATGYWLDSPVRVFVETMK